MKSFYERHKLTILLLSLCALLIIILTKGKTIMEKSVTKIWDFITEKRIETLHPMIREKARQFIAQAEQQGIKLRVTDAFRSIDEQNKLYAQGRTTPGKIVTNAKGGQSFHNFGLAIDVVEIINGQANYNTDWNKIAAIGKSLGFQWGGNFSSLVDKPHFQFTFGNSTSQLLAKYNSGQLSGGYVKIV